MRTIARLLLFCVTIGFFAFAPPLRAEEEKRIAFVVGNAAYQAAPLGTAANDAGLIAQTLQAAGFDVSGARDLDGEALRAAFRDFIDKAQASGPNTVAFVYLAGYGLQFEGENYFVPVDARIASATDVPAEALRISDYMKRLAGLPLKASFIVLDAARANPFAQSGQPLAGGLALAEPEPNMLIAFNAAPGTAAPEESGPYGAYAQALTEMIREGGLSPAEVFDGVRMRVSEATKGAEVPWSSSRIEASFVFFERAPDAPPPALNAQRMETMRSAALRDLSPQEAYAAALERDTVHGYEEFLAAYPSDPLASRVRVLLAARREALTWHRTCRVNTPDAYWSYLRRYPKGPHAAEARYRLEARAVPLEPPPSFAPIAYDVPPPPPPEIVYVERPVVILADPVYALPPPPPIVFLAPPPPQLVFTPPLVVAEPDVLPVPVFVPIPTYDDPPRYIAPPPDNIVFANIHNTTVTNNIVNVINQQAAPAAPSVHGPSVAAGVVAGAAAGAIAAKVLMPPSVAKKAALIERQGGSAALPGQGLPARPAPDQAPPAQRGAPGFPPSQKPAAGLPGSAQPQGHALPGMSGAPLPGQRGKPGVGAQQQPSQGAPGAAPPPQGHALPGAAGGKPLPGQGGKPGPAAQGTAPQGAPGASPPPQGHALPGAAGGKPLPGQEGKPGPAAQGTAPQGAPGAAPPPQGHALPGAAGGKPLPGQGGKPGPASKEGPAPLRKGLTGKCLVRVKARLARHWVAKVLRMACPAARCPCPKRGGRPQGLSRNSPNGRRSRSGSIYPRRFIARRIQAVCRRRGIRRSKRSPGARLNRPSLGTRHPSRPSNGIHRRRRNNGIRRNKRNNGARLNRFSLGTRHPSRPSNGIHRRRRNNGIRRNKRSPGARRSRHKGGSSATAASPACRLAPNGLPVNARPSCAAPLCDKAHRAPRAEKGYRDQSRRALRPKDRLALRGWREAVNKGKSALCRFASTLR